MPIFARNLVIIIVLMMKPSNSEVHAQTFSSGPKKTPLIELYTSEGCSSCPPAEQWLNTLAEHKGLWHQFVPIAFHVDYWDYIGWKDTFASASNSRRQRQYKQEGNLKGVYTPSFVFMGNEWKSWYFERKIPNVNWSEIGDLRVKIVGENALVSFNPSQSSAVQLKLHFSILGFDLTTRVKRGENSGKILKHEFVSLARTSQVAEEQNGLYQWQIKIPNLEIFQQKSFLLDTDPKQRLAYVTWVTAVNRLQPIQATGAWRATD